MPKVRQNRGGQRGNVETLANGAKRVRVYAGVDPVSKRPHYLKETVPVGPDLDHRVEQVRTRLLSQIDERRNPRTDATVAQLIEKHLATATLDPGTLRGYQRNFRNHVRPLLGHRKVGATNAQTLDSFYAELRRCRLHCDGTRHVDHRTPAPHDCDDRCRPHECEPLDTSTVRRIHFLLSGAFKRAVRWGWITSNPATTAEPPPEKKPHPRPPTPAEAARIVNAAATDPVWFAYVWLAMTTGARRAELCALRWSEVDLDRGVLVLRFSVDQNGAAVTVKPTKTHQQRRIALDPESLAVLTNLRAEAEQNAVELEVNFDSSTFVFSPAPDGRTIPKPDTATQRYGRLASRLGIDTNLHKLRHFSATELITAGVDPRTVSGRLGHAGGGTTTLRTYSAWVAETDQRAAASLATRMPAFPSIDPAERAKTNPQAPYEHLAAAIRRQVLDGTLKPGDPAPTQKQLMAEHEVSAGTANRAVALLKTWQLIDTSRGRRATILTPPDAVLLDRDSANATGRGGASEPSTHTGTDTLDLCLVHLGNEVRTFSAIADPADAAKLTTLLLNAARRHGGGAGDAAEYELEVRDRNGNLLTTFVAS